MAFPIAAVAAAAVPLISQGINAASTGSMNAKTRDHQYSMWQQQRDLDRENWNMANQYNEAMWEKQKTYNQGLWDQQNDYNQRLWNQENAYNSPMAQMQRFKEAGLNPNLIYGQSNMGGSMATANLESTEYRSSKIDSHAPQQWQPRAPQFDLQDGVMAYLNFRQMSAQTNNLEQQNKVLEEEAFNKQIQGIRLLQDVNKADFDQGISRELRDNTIEMANQQARKLKVENDLALNRDQREAAMNASNLQEALKRMKLLDGQLTSQQIDQQLKKADLELKELDLNLKQMGIQPGDNIFFRVLGQLYNKFFGNDAPVSNQWDNEKMIFTIPEPPKR